MASGCKLLFCWGDLRFRNTQANQGRKVFTVQRLPPKVEVAPGCTRVVKVAGFSLHADVGALGHE